MHAAGQKTLCITISGGGGGEEGGGGGEEGGRRGGGGGEEGGRGGARKMGKQRFALIFDLQISY